MEYYKQANLEKILEHLVTYHQALSNLYILTYLFQHLSNKILGTIETPLVPFFCKVNNPDFEVYHPYAMRHSILEIHFDLFIHFCGICCYPSKTDSLPIFLLVCLIFFLLFGRSFYIFQVAIYIQSIIFNTNFLPVCSLWCTFSLFLWCFLLTRVLNFSIVKCIHLYFYNSRCYILNKKRYLFPCTYILLYFLQEILKLYFKFRTLIVQDLFSVQRGRYLILFYFQHR